MQKPTTPEITFTYDWKKKYPYSTEDLSFVSQWDIEDAVLILNDWLVARGDDQNGYSEEQARKALWSFFILKVGELQNQFVEDLAEALKHGDFRPPAPDLNLAEEARWDRADERYDRASGN